MFPESCDICRCSLGGRIAAPCPKSSITLTRREAEPCGRTNAAVTTNARQVVMRRSTTRLERYGSAHSRT
jgi:hypothetical protein